jgi:hypothetical protein
MMGTAFAVLLLVSYLSGLYLALKVPSMRVGMFVALFSGLAVVSWALYAL